MNSKKKKTNKTMDISKTAELTDEKRKQIFHDSRPGELIGTALKLGMGMIFYFGDFEVTRAWLRKFWKESEYVYKYQQEEYFENEGSMDNSHPLRNRNTTDFDKASHAPDTYKGDKPPKGLKPRFVFLEERLDQIGRAIQRYMEARKEPPYEWFLEAEEIKQKLAEIHTQRQKI